MPFWNIAGQVLKQGFNLLSNRAAENRSRRYQIEDEKRADQRAIRFWNMQNEYNSPENKMRRLEEAGINKNWFLSKGGSGLSTAAGEVGLHSAPPVQGRPTDFSGLAVAGQLAQTGTIEQQRLKVRLENEKLQGKVLISEDILKRVGAIVQQTVGEIKEEELWRLMNTREMDLDMRGHMVNKVAAEASKMFTEAEVAKITSTEKISQALQLTYINKARAAGIQLSNQKLREQIRGLRLNNEYKSLVKELRSLGINSDDPLYLQVVGYLTNALIEQAKARVFSN